jgi:hypothetical protein
MTPSPASDFDPREEMAVKNPGSRSETPGVSMDIMSLLRLMGRHWRVTVPAGVATLILVVAALVLSSPTYEANASVALFSPPTAPETSDGAASAEGQNPYTRYGDLSVVADIVARKMASDGEQAKLKAEGVTGYTVVANRLQRGPLVEVTGTGPNPEAAITSAKLVIKEFGTALEDAQRAADADPNYFITSREIQAPEAAVAQVGSTLRTAIAALAVGGLGTLGLAIGAESVTRRRAAARAGTDDDDGLDLPDAAYQATGPGERGLHGAARPAADPADDRPRAPSSAAGRPSAVPVGDPDPRTRGEANGSHRTSQRTGTLHLAPQPQQQGQPRPQQPQRQSPPQQSQPQQGQPRLEGAQRKPRSQQGQPRPERAQRKPQSQQGQPPPEQADRKPQPQQPELKQPQQAQPQRKPQSPPQRAQAEEATATPESQEWTRWLPSADSSPSTNGHKKPTTDRSP